MMPGKEIRSFPRREGFTGFNSSQRAVLRREAWLRRLAGWSFTEIADDMGVSTGYVSKLIAAYMEENTTPNREMARQIEMERLDALEKIALQKFIADPEHPDIDAGKFILAITQRRSAMMGLDEPVKSQATVDIRDSFQAELDAVLAEAAETERRAREKQQG